MSKHSWSESLHAFKHPKVITMLFLGFSAGIPILLIFSSLSLWLREAGLDRSTTTFFSWAALGYSFKFVWAPLIDILPVPFLTRLLGRRRAWLLVSQFAVIAAIISMASINPASGDEALVLMGLAAVFLGFSSATQDIVIDAFRIESAPAELQALLSATYIIGYRIAMIVAGAGALFLAQALGSEVASYSYNAWSMTYYLMSAVMLMGIVTTFIIPEPEQLGNTKTGHSTRDYLGLLILFFLAVFGFISVYFFSAGFAANIKTSLADLLHNKVLAGFFVEVFRLLLALSAGALISMLVVLTGAVKRSLVQDAYINPIADFFQRYGVQIALLLLALVGLYRISDIVLGVISNVFYLDLGFSKNEIAGAVQTFGLIMTILGGFIGGLLSIHYGVMRILFLGAVLSSATNLLFMLLAGVGKNLALLYLVVAADNLSAGLASAAFIAFLSSLTNISFTATQYAIFSSLMTLFPKITGGYSGSMVDNIGYSNFFLVTALMGVPVLILIWLAGKKLPPSKEQGDKPLADSNNHPSTHTQEAHGR